MKPPVEEPGEVTVMVSEEFKKEAPAVMKMEPPLVRMLMAGAAEMLWVARRARGESRKRP
jgi:hypothetical protein